MEEKRSYNVMLFGDSNVGKTGKKFMQCLFPLNL